MLEYEGHVCNENKLIINHLAYVLLNIQLGFPQWKLLIVFTKMMTDMKIKHKYSHVRIIFSCLSPIPTNVLCVTEGLKPRWEWYL